MGLFGKKKKKTHEQVAAELGVPVWWVSRFLGYSIPINGDIKDKLKKITGEDIKDEIVDSLYKKSISPVHEKKVYNEKKPTLFAHELARKILPYVIAKKISSKRLDSMYDAEIGYAVMIAVENSLKRNEDHPSKIDEEKFAEDIATHLAKRGRIRDPSEIKEDLVKIMRTIKEYSSTLLGLDPIREEDKIVKATSHLSAYASDKEAEDSYLEKVAPEVFEKWWQLKVAVAEALGNEPYRHEVAKGGRKTRKGKQKPPAKFKQVQKQVEAELRAKGVPEEEIYRELEKKGIPRELAKVILDVKAAETTPTSQIHRMIERHVGRDPQKAKALLEAMERTGKLVPVPKYWANIVSKIATGEIKENELLEALAVSKVFHTAYSKAIAKAAERGEPENTMQRMMFIKRVLEEAHKETLEALKEHPVYGEFIRMKAPAIEREIKATAETLSKTYYAKARGDPSLTINKFMWLELNSQIGVFAGIISTLRIALEDFSVLGKLDETTGGVVYSQLIKDAAVLSWKAQEREYVGITVLHELVRSSLAK